MLKIRNSFLTITLVVAIQSCTLGTSNSSNSTTQDIPDIKYIVAGKALYTVDNFKVSTTYKLTNDIKSDTLNSYLFQDLENRVFYRISVENLVQGLSSIGLEEFNSAYEKSYFREYERSLKNGNYDYKIGKIKNKDAIFNSYIVTNNNLINDQKALFKSKSVTLLNINKSYTISVIAEPGNIDEAFKAFSSDFEFIYNETSQKYTSQKFNYEILIHDGYTLTQPVGNNIDFKVVSKSIMSLMTITVSERTNEEMNITAHDYSHDLIQELYNQINPQAKIISTEKIYIDNIKAFLVINKNEVNSTNVLEIYFYKGNSGYLMSGTCTENDFQICKNEFLNTFYSFKFKN